MNSDSVVLVVLGGLGLLALVLTVALWRLRVRTRRELGAARAESAGLQARIDEIERRLSAPTPGPRPEDPEYTITDLGRVEEPAQDPAEIDKVLFADIVLRETVVKAASLAHGVRRALAPEVRNRIRFEVRREIRRARKQRKADMREARREWESRQRAAMTDDENAA